MNPSRQGNGRLARRLALKGLAAATNAAMSYLDSRRQPVFGPTPPQTRTGAGEASPHHPQPRYTATPDTPCGVGTTSSAPAEGGPDPAVTAAMLASQWATARASASRIYGSW